MSPDPAPRQYIVRNREVSYSVRSGQLIEGIVNPIIVSHPGNTKLQFRGNPLVKTEITYYDKPQVPAQGCAILVKDTWGLFEWAQRLAFARLDFELPGSRFRLNMFVNDCIELYLHGTRPRHGELFRFQSWDVVGKYYHASLGFQRIDRLLGRGIPSRTGETRWIDASSIVPTVTFSARLKMRGIASSRQLCWHRKL